MIKKIGLLLLLLLITAGSGGLFYRNSLKPDYKGNISLQGIQKKVEVFYDSYGIPHIYAENDLDAMTALGYVHAQDRLWQMELVSRIAAGRLSEIFGEKLIKTDKFYLSLGIAKNSHEIVADIDRNTTYYKQTMAYLEGVNNFLNDGPTPIEYSILGIEKNAFTLEDVYNVFGYMAYGFAMGNQTDPLMSAIQEKLGDEYLNNLNLIIDPNSTLINTIPAKNIESDALSFSKILSEIRDKTPVPPFIGSNSWVLAPEKTKNRKVIFANDPHIGYSQPAVWYQAHISTPSTENYGFYLALTPFPLLGHNYKIAYGLTMFENDDIDLYVEKNNPDNPNEYLFGNTFKKYQSRTLNIPVKEADTIYHTIKESIHGPIINEVVSQVRTKNPVAMYWVYTQKANKLLEASYRMSRATNIDEFELGPSIIHAPGLNVMYGDAQGNVAWWAAGNLYKRTNNAPTKLLLDGRDPENHQLEFTPFSKNPQAINPDWNYVYSCNNQPDSIISNRYIPGYYIAQDRAKRVVELLEQKDDWTLSETMNMMTDNLSSIAYKLKNRVLKNIRAKEFTAIEKNAIQVLSDWKGEANLKSIGTTIYTQFTYEYLKLVFEDELGEEMYKQLAGTHLMGRMLEPLLKNKYDLWMDNIDTENIKETNIDVQLIAFKKAIKVLLEQLGDDIETWTWDRVHTVEYKHPLGEVEAFRSYFNVGPFPIAGTNEVLNNQIFTKTPDAKFKVHSGPSTRRIIDFSDIENARAILPTGQSGNILSPHYKDQAQLFVEGKFIPMLLNKDLIKQSKNKLVLQPN